jgi:hypothetical protein
VPATPEIVTEVALGTFHVKVELPPGTMLDGDEEKLEPATVGQGVTFTVACNCIEAQEPAPAAVRV